MTKETLQTVCHYIQTKLSDIEDISDYRVENIGILPEGIGVSYENYIGHGEYHLYEWFVTWDQLLKPASVVIEELTEEKEQIQQQAIRLQKQAAVETQRKRVAAAYNAIETAQEQALENHDKEYNKLLKLLGELNALPK